MALEPRSPGYAQARQELLEYCRENHVAFPHQEYPFDWPDCIPRASSPSSDIAHCFISSQLNPEEPESLVEPDSEYLNRVLNIHDPGIEINDIQQTKPFQFELPLLHEDAGTDNFRKYGPDTLARCTAVLSRIPLLGENGLELPRDQDMVKEAIAKDSKLSVTQEQAQFLKDTISQTKIQSLDIILPKVCTSLIDTENSLL